MKSSLVLFDIFTVKQIMVLMLEGGQIPIWPCPFTLLFRNLTSIIAARLTILLFSNFNPAIIATMLIILLSGLSPALCGDIFFWTDEKGVQHYSNVRPSSSAKEVQTYTEKNGNEKPYEDGQDLQQTATSTTEQNMTNEVANQNNNAHINTKTDRINTDRKLNIAFKVIKIYDGDSIKIEGAGMALMVRLAGIDAPETGGKKSQKSGGSYGGQPFSQEAKYALTRMLERKDIHIKNYNTDRYNRLLAEVFASDGTLVNLEMVRQGMAEVYRGSTPGNLDIAVYKKAEKEAKRGYRGIWSLGANYESPKAWRKRNPRK
ncbi:MAG: thermonuclease family protein [Desulfamplus sp.]|nr:thermonuclease family protein [Desulfamplus sp.]